MRRRKALTDRLYLRGLVHWVWGYDNTGKRWFESTHQTERRAALEAAREIERRRAVPSNRAADELTLTQALGLVIDHDRRQGNAEKTIRFHRDKARHLVRLLGAERRVALLQLLDTNGYTDKRLEEGAHRHTVQKELRVLVQGLFCAKEIGLYEADPSALWPRAFKKKRNFYRPRTRWLSTEAQAQALVDHTSTGTMVRTCRRAHIAAYLNTGVRKDELYEILPEHVNLKQRTVWVDGTKTDGAARIIPLNVTALAVFKAKLAKGQPGRALFEHWASADRDLRAAYLRARVTAATALGVTVSDLEGWPSDLSFNDLRRTFCSLLATRGVPMQHAAKLLGHASLDMVMEVYAQLAPDSLQSAVDMLPALHVAGVTDAVTSIVSETGSGALDEPSKSAASA